MGKKMTYEHEKPNLSNSEKKRIPIIDAPVRVKKDRSFAIKIELGKLLPNPHKSSDSSERIEVYCDDEFLARADYNGGQVILKLLTK